MLRIEVSEAGRALLPAIDLDDPRIVIGSAAGARIRLPSTIARDVHVVVERGAWTALAEVSVDGVPRQAGDTGALAAGVELALGGYRVRIAPAPPGAAASPPQRTESLARELVRSLLGDNAAPSFEIERGPVGVVIGARRALPPPEATVVVGRGDEADWVILDEDLSRAHVELRRGWDGVVVRDLASKNGTTLDGARVTGEMRVQDGARLELGAVVLRFRDPAERHLRGAPAEATAAPRTAPVAPVSSSPARLWPIVAAATLSLLAVAGLAWVLAS